MLKKLSVLAAFCFAAIPLAPPAAAWDEVCVKFPLWKTWFIGHFSVIYGNEVSHIVPRWIPTKESYGGGRIEFPGAFFTKNNPQGRAVPAEGGIHSPDFPANQHRCVSIRDLPPGKEFTVIVRTTDPASAAHCPPHPVHAPKVGYAQQHGRYKRIWWEAWGSVFDPQCKYWRESN